MNRFVIVCVKLKSKYPSSMVNNLYDMCCKNISYQFDFFCYTDDSHGLKPNINVIPFVDHGLDVIVYNKLFLFSEWMDTQLPSGPRVYFDLDLIIKQNVDDIVSFNKKHLSVIYAAWRKEHRRGFPIFHHPFNSSCMTWQTPHTRPIWEHLITDPEFFMNKYHWGMDSFLSYEKENIGVQIEHFPERKFYSFLYGVDHFENTVFEPQTHAYRPSKFVEVIKKIPIVLLNGPTTIEDYNKEYKRHYGV